MGIDSKATGVSMTRIGEQLKEAREKKSVTIDQVQKQTRIHSTVLKALEEGRCDGVLTATYVKSFLKKYAEYLGLDARQMLAEYGKLRQVPPIQQIAIVSKVDSAKSADISNFFGMVRILAAAALIIAIVMFAGAKTVGLFKRWREHNKPSSAARGVGWSGVSEKRPDLSAAKVPVMHARSVPAPSKKKDESKPAAAIPKEAHPKEKPIVKAAVLITPVAQNVPLKLLVRANQPVLVKIKTDGNLLFSRVLQRGAVESFTAADRINIYTAKAEAIELFLNGKGLGSPGKGQMKNIEVTRAGLKIK